MGKQSISRACYTGERQVCARLVGKGSQFGRLPVLVVEEEQYYRVKVKSGLGKREIVMESIVTGLDEGERKKEVLTN